MKREEEENSNLVAGSANSSWLNLEIQELEPIVASGLWTNSNETLVTDIEEE